MLTTDPPEVGGADVPHLLAAGLAGEVRARLPQDHPLRPALRAGALALGARHALIRAELRPLLAAWAAEDIPVLLFKGFALAEFEYAAPGERFYGDVDVLLPNDPAVLTRAAHLALALGWRSDGLHADPALWTHEAAHLFGPGGHTRLDVHRFVTAWAAGPQHRERALTAAVWRGARPVDWGGVPIRRPDPRDALVVNVALGRAWGGEAGGLKPADYPDTRVLTARYALSPAELETRAAELGARHTWAAFREVCDPARRRFGLGNPATPHALDRAARRDGVSRRARLWRVHLRVLPRRLRLAPALLPDVIAARRAVLAGGDPRAHLARWTPPGEPRPLPAGILADTVAGVRWLTRLFYPRQSRVGTCVPRAYATYRALRRQGHPAVFVSGVARTAAGVYGHAWVEDEHGPLDAYEEPLNGERFSEVFRFPEGVGG